MKLFVRFALAKGVITYGLELMTALFSIVQGIVNKVFITASTGFIFNSGITSSIEDAVEDSGFIESIPIWAVTFVGSLFITILSFVMIMSVYGRFFRLYMYTAIAPVPLAAFGGEPTAHIGKSFLKAMPRSAWRASL